MKELVAKAYLEVLQKSVSELEKRQKTKSIPQILESLKKSEDAKCRMWHFSPAQDLKELKKSDDKSMIYLYKEGAKTEPKITDKAKSKYMVELPSDHKIYDLSKDSDGLLEQVGHGRDDNESIKDFIVRKLKGSGYAGMCHSNGPHPGVVAAFNNIPVSKELAKTDSEDWKEAK